MRLNNEYEVQGESLYLTVDKCDNGFIISARCNIPIISDTMGFNMHKIAKDENEVMKLLSDAIGEYKECLSYKGKTKPEVKK